MPVEYTLGILWAMRPGVLEYSNDRFRHRFTKTRHFTYAAEKPKLDNARYGQGLQVTALVDGGHIKQPDGFITTLDRGSYRYPPGSS